MLNKQNMAGDSALPAMWACWVCIVAACMQKSSRVLAHLESQEAAAEVRVLILAVLQCLLQ